MPISVIYADGPQARMSQMGSKRDLLREKGFLGGMRVLEIRRCLLSPQRSADSELRVPGFTVPGLRTVMTKSL